MKGFVRSMPRREALASCIQLLYPRAAGKVVLWSPSRYGSWRVRAARYRLDRQVAHVSEEVEYLTQLRQEQA